MRNPKLNGNVVRISLTQLQTSCSCEVQLSQFCKHVVVAEALVNLLSLQLIQYNCVFDQVLWY